MSNKFYCEYPRQGSKATNATYRQTTGGVAPAKPQLHDTEAGWPDAGGKTRGNLFNRKTKTPVVKTAVTRKGIH